MSLRLRIGSASPAPAEVRVSATPLGSGKPRGLGALLGVASELRTAGLASAPEHGPGENTLLVLGVAEFMSTALGLRDNDPIDAVLWSEVDELLLDPFRGGPGNAPNTTPDVRETTAADCATLLVVTCSRIGYRFQPN